MSRGSGGTEYGHCEHWASPVPDVAEYKTLYACHPWPHVGGYQLSVFNLGYLIFDKKQLWWKAKETSKLIIQKLQHMETSLCNQ